MSEDERSVGTTHPGMAFVLGGGGGRGALQVGAIRALHEAGLRPDLLVGTSAGAVNATFLAARGIHHVALDELEANWRDASRAELLPANYLWLTLRLMFQRVVTQPEQRIRAFFEEHGVTPDLRFADLRRGIRLIQVSADLESGDPVLYGLNPHQSVLQGLLASTALTPWVHPLKDGDRSLIDGGAVSNLPIEPALSVGAKEIIALDISDPRLLPRPEYGAGSFMQRLLYLVEHRQVELELALAEAVGVPVYHIFLQAETPVSTWDFSRADELSKRGYQITRREIAARPAPKAAPLRRWFRRET